VTAKNTRQEALQMSRDLTSLVDRQSTGTDTAVREYVRALLRQYRAEEDARLERIRAFEAEGRRIVNGGQTGQNTWDITDWRTGDLIIEGTGDHRAYDEAAERLDPDGKWLHVDNIDTESADVEPVGIPASLANALQDWLGSAGTSDEDVAQFVGWPVEEVGRHREEF
jgi:hypothetical protein